MHGGALALAMLVGYAYVQDTRSIPAGNKTNITFILVDNLGGGELGAYRGGAALGASTPRIDKLASEGLRLTK